MPKPNLRPVLLVEDSPDDIEFAIRAFEKCGAEHPLAIADQGDLALALLRGEAAHDFGRGPLRPALVLLDLNIPGLDGRQLLEVLKSDPELKNIPVVVLTTSTHPSDVESCYRLGANSYHQKPSDFRQYEETIKQITEYWLQAVVSSLAASEAFGSAVPVGSG